MRKFWSRFMTVKYNFIFLKFFLGGDRVFGDVREGAYIPRKQMGVTGIFGVFLIDKNTYKVISNSMASRGRSQKPQTERRKKQLHVMLTDAEHDMLEEKARSESSGIIKEDADGSVSIPFFQRAQQRDVVRYHPQQHLLFASFRRA
jgi:hypothetical protein